MNLELRKQENTCVMSVYIDGRRINASAISYTEGIMTLGCYAERPTYDYQGNELYNNDQSIKDINDLSLYMKENHPDAEIRTGWSTSTQYWKEWKYKAL